MSVAFWSTKLTTDGKSVVVQPPENFVLIVTNAALDIESNNKGNVGLKITTDSIDGSKDSAILCTLNGEKFPQHSLNLCLGYDVESSFSLVGAKDAKGTVFLSGYFQPAPDNEGDGMDYDDEEGMFDEDDSEEDDDEENGSGVYSGSRNSGSKKSKSDYNAVALRQYELSKLRYYFAIAECDSVDTANALYEALDGVEFENSAMALEIRFVPDVLDLSDREVRDKCSHAPDARRYKPPEFVVNAKQHTNVTCTWDEGEKDREKTLTNFSAWRNLKE
eukprot:gene31216-40185_t